MFFTFESIGTKWQVDFGKKTSSSNVKRAKRQILSFLKDFDLVYSRFNPKSLVYKISKEKGEFIFPESSMELFELYAKLYNISKGKFTPLIGNTLSLLGYDVNYSFDVKSRISPPRWEEILYFKYPKLIVKEPTILDFGGVGKGYAIDKISEILKKENILSFIIDGGGDILSFNYKAKIGLENPLNLTQVIGRIDLNNKSICGSALNRRSWSHYSHIIDPDTINSPKGILATWVTSSTCIEADALATALFLVDPDLLSNNFDFDYLILFDDLTVAKSNKFDCEIYYN